MKITEVEAIVIRQPDLNDQIADGSQDDLIVRVHTDAGIVGVGEVDSAPEVVKAIIEAPPMHWIATGLRHVLIGQDPLDIEGLWEKMYRACIFFGRRGVAIHAISGVDLALWDIKGKALGQPVCQLLGRVRRQRVRAYASTLMPDTEAEVRSAVGRLCQQGFTAIKLGWGPLGRVVEHDIALARAAKEVAGHNVEILIDAGLGYGADADRAIRVARELEAMGVFWLEEPFMPDELNAYHTLANAVDLRIAAGEQDASRWMFETLIDEGGVDVIQPDVTRCGGLTEALRIIKIAEARQVAVVPHAWKSGVIKAASLHLNAVLPEALFQEYCVADTPINRHLTQQHFPLNNGYVDIPTAPGLGVDLDQDVLARLTVGPKPIRLA